MKTGQVVAERGLYSTECCDKELIFDTGDTFSRCPRCQHLCEWEYAYDLVVSEDAEQTNGVAA